MKPVVMEASRLRLSFGAIEVTNDVNLTIRAGARHALIGPNGAGKTTLLNLLSGMLRPNSGRITLNGNDVTRASPQARVKQGLVRTFQVNNLFRELTVLENVYLAASEHLGASRDMIRAAGLRTDILAAAESTIDRLGLADSMHKKVAEIPYGRQRLVEFAIGLSLAPKVLLLDEPTAGIPSFEVSGLLDTIERLPMETAIILIEHDMQVVKRFASEVTVLVAGAVLMTGTPESVISSEAVRKVYLGQSGYERFHTSSLST
jgi:ABC-type branched-subunit amino acid transport system ATPase component